MVVAYFHGKTDLYSLFGFHSNSLISLFIFLIICSSFFLISEFFFLSYFSISCSHQSSIFCFLFLKRTEYLKSAFFFISSIFLSHFLVMLYLSFIEKNSVGKSQRIVNSTEFFFTVNYYLTLIFNFSRFFYENYKLTYNLFYISNKCLYQTLMMDYFQEKVNNKLGWIIAILVGILIAIIVKDT